MTKYIKTSIMILIFPFLDPFISLNTRCNWSKKYFDMHDYKVHKGGDGIPKHFHIYECYNCGKRYII